MNLVEKNQIFDRLIEMKVEIRVDAIPDPSYIHQKIGECHQLIEEVEKYYISVSKEISIHQRAANNALAAYESKKENLIISNDQIKNLPSIKDREAKANSLLKKELTEVKGYQNELSDLNNLLKAINLKLKNLNRINTDIRMLLRLLESQIKVIGTGPATDPAAISLLEEMKKSQLNEDSFKESESQVEENNIIDPTKNLNINDLLSTNTEEDDDPITKAFGPQNLPNKLINPEPSEPDPTGKDAILGEDMIQDITENNSSEEIEKEVEKSISEDKGIDLDELFVSEKALNEKGGNNQKENQQEEPKSPENKNESETGKNSNDIDIDKLLSQFN